MLRGPRTRQSNAAFSGRGRHYEAMRTVRIALRCNAMLDAALPQSPPRLHCRAFKSGGQSYRIHSGAATRNEEGKAHQRGGGEHFELGVRGSLTSGVTGRANGTGGTLRNSLRALRFTPLLDGGHQMRMPRLRLVIAIRSVFEYPEVMKQACQCCHFDLAGVYRPQTG